MNDPTFDKKEMESYIHNHENPVAFLNYKSYILRVMPNMYIPHYGKNFYGKIHYSVCDNKYKEVVYVNKRAVSIIEATQLENLIIDVNNKYGWE